MSAYARGRAQGLGRPRAADEDRQPRLDGSRRADGIAHRVVPAVVRHGLAVEQAPDESDRLVEPVESLAEPRAEIDARRRRARARTSRRRGRGRPGRPRGGPGSSRAWRSGPGCGTCWPRRAGPAGRARSGPRARRASSSPRASRRASRPHRRAGGRRSRASPSRPASTARHAASRSGHSVRLTQNAAPNRTLAQARIVSRKRKTGMPAANASASVSGSDGDSTSASDRRRPKTTSL